jgi:hypothetical protein
MQQQAQTNWAKGNINYKFREENEEVMICNHNLG